MLCFKNDIKQFEDYFLIDLVNAGATISNIAAMLNGEMFTGEDGNIYEIMEEIPLF